MSFGYYQLSVPVMIRMLGNLSAILTKGADFAAANGLDPKELIEARLAPDMYPLSRQVQIATDSAKGAAARLAGVPVPSFPDEETSFPELQERVARTIDFLKSLDPAAFDAAGERTIILPLRSGEMTFTPDAFLLNFALPNLYFHITTAYGLLRHKGVPVGKMDYLTGGQA